MKFPFKGITRQIYQKVKQVIGEKRVWGLFEYFTKLSNFVKLCMFYCRNFLSHEECYITCSGKRDGAGAQALAVMSTMLFAEANRIKYVHTPFASLQHNYNNENGWEKKWEDFFGLGKDELKRGDNDLRMVPELSLEENPLKIKKQAKTLFVVRHCHDYADLFPNRYSRIKNKLVEKYYANSKSGYDLNYDLDKVNVAVHIRRGDVNGNNQFRDKFTDNRYIYDVISRILELIASQGLEPSFCVYSEGESTNFKELDRLKPKYFLNINPFSTFHNLVCADVLLMSKSTFSYCAALISNGIELYESFRHKPQASWIKVKENADFDRKLFSIKLQKYISERRANSG